ncbi:hypothetical protein [Corallococcus sp. AB049A]|uniref:hypothetical protein n=1 Tax=Corallococcus sp. AB049A TaxID=2316721 RepID=UPI0011C35E5C|nr:hypothetical protein [Corallococcus sp. AB049A]
MTTFKCPSCNIGEVREVAQPGRRMHFRNIPDLEIPADVLIPTCSNPECGEDWINREVAKRVDAAMAEVYQTVVASKVETTLSKLKPVIHQRELERLLDLSGGYISKLKSGKETSAPLVSALMLLAESPQQRIEELRELWKTKPKPKALPALAFSDFRWVEDSVEFAMLEMALPPVERAGSATIFYSARTAGRSVPLSLTPIGENDDEEFDAPRPRFPELRYPS